VLRSNLPRAVRHLRRRRGWRQQDLGERSGLSRESISRLERGSVRGLTIGSIERVAMALDALVDVTLRWEGAELDRTLDAAHARLQERVADDLGSIGWLVRVEVSFNHYGDRGRIDVLGFHPPSRILLVVEVKTAIGDLQDTLGKLDVKVRLARAVARDAGWHDADAVVPVLAIAEGRSVRRIIATHPTLFSRYAVRGRQATAWLRRPASNVPTGILWYLSRPDSRGGTVTRASRVRTVRKSP
jgi:transcriptional regulator with XRE-family HTH domain